jgi:AcrR family transcriptional regulator
MKINCKILLTDSVKRVILRLTDSVLARKKVRSLEKFEALSPEKQNAIMEAALSVFGAMGYRKASMGDIAASAGVSKAALFHYFGTKKALYLYLFETCGALLLAQIKQTLALGVTDFFEKITRASETKMAFTGMYPSVLLFFESVYFERDDEVCAEIQVFLDDMSGYQREISTQNVDVFKFKDGVDPALVMRTLVLMAEGLAGIFKRNLEMDTNAAFEEYLQCMALLRKHFYKEEYL